jgi:hypothetical protein
MKWKLKLLEGLEFQCLHCCTLKLFSQKGLGGYASREFFFIENRTTSIGSTWIVVS